MLIPIDVVKKDGEDKRNFERMIRYYIEANSMI